jgi:hypothetical protein
VALAATLLQVGWVDPGPLVAAAVFETMRATTIAVFRRPAPPPTTSSEPSTGEEDS